MSRNPMWSSLTAFASSSKDRLSIDWDVLPVIEGIDRSQSKNCTSDQVNVCIHETVPSRESGLSLQYYRWLSSTAIQPLVDSSNRCSLLVTTSGKEDYWYRTSNSFFVVRGRSDVNVSSQI
jgi:hypothetical protein